MVSSARLRLAGAVVLATASALGCGAGQQPTTTTSAAGQDLALAGHRGAAGAETWAPWPQALHDAQHSDAASVKGPREGRLRWSRRLEGNVTPGPVVAADGTIVVASNAGVLHGLDPGTGQDRWSFDGGGSYGSDLSTSAAIMPSGLVLWPGPDATLFALSPTGDLRWRLRSASGSQFTSPAVTAAGDVVVGDTGGGLVALRPTDTGPEVQWRADLGDPSYGSAVWAADGATAYQSVTSGVVAVRAGEIVWRSAPLPEIIEVSPAVAPDGTVVIGTNDPFQYGLDQADGSVAWRHPRPAWTYSSPGVTRDAIVYYGDHRNRITGLDATDGTPVFSFQGSRVDDGPGGVGIWTSVLVDVDHTVYAGTRQGLVYAVDRDARLLWQLDTGVTVDSYPALGADGALVIGTTDGRVLCLE